MNDPKARLVDLLEYIEQVEKLKKTAPFKVPNDFFRAFQSDLRGLPGIEFNLVNGGDDVWARISRLTEEAPPEPPESLRAWVSITKSPDKAPELRAEIVVKKDNQQRRLTVDQFPGLRKIFDKYLTDQWTPWASSERVRRKTITLYNKLFAIQQTIEADGGEAALETVWGMGFSVWKKEGAPGTIEYPLLSQICEISLDTKTFALEIRPRDADPILELDCYVDSGVEGVGRTEAFWRTYRETATSRPTPFEFDTTEPILKAAVGFLDPAGQFLDSKSRGDGQFPAAIGTLQVTDGWVLFVRKRSGHLFLQDIERLKNKLKDEDDLPSALAAFVTEGSDSVAIREKIEYRGLSSSGAGAGVRELFFPMPYNSEQVSIVEKLETSDGVVVQGPPGTGKTHTIANVICHFLAHGRRVLVTSKGEEALRVLQEKIPEEIRALSVALLTDEHTGMKQFEHSIQTIASNVSDMQPRRVEGEIVAHEARLGELHQKIAALDHSITELAERQLARIKFEDRDISPEELARFVVEKSDEFCWFTDVLDPKTQAQPGFTNEDVCALRESRRRAGVDLKYLTCQLPATDSLPAPDAILAIHQDLQRSRNIDAAVQAGAVLPLADTTAGTFERAKTLAEHFTKGNAMFAQIRAQQRPWTSTIRALYRTPTGDLPKQLLATCSQILKTESGRRLRLTAPVSVPIDAEVKPDLLEAIDRLRFGNRCLPIMTLRVRNSSRVS